MQYFKNFFKSITPFEYCLWGGSVLATALGFVLCKSNNYASLAASLIGVTALIFVAKGNVIGEILSVVFAAFYGAISFAFRYYGEMITYLGMTAPIAIATVVVWLRHPFQGKKTEVKINDLKRKEFLFLAFLSAAVTAAFYFILQALNTANLIASTLSVLTSFLAAYLQMRRSSFYALAYAANDVVLIVLWSLAVRQSAESVSMIVCFSAFLLNDLYGFYNWMRMRRNQRDSG